ncbi:monocarboxylate transporter 2-like [Ptychodera flava]|uniref:monocarboxylate transporter 2-like n=1 Tax=Ptychodera flava TaxID=63121 RepID=UPI00396A8989
MDGGCLGWSVVFASHLCCVFTFGVYQASGPLFMAMQKHFDETSERISWILSLEAFIQWGFGPLSNVHVEALGYRRTALIGTAMSSTGLFLCAFAPSVEFLYFSFGILVGLGYATIMPAAFGIVAHYIKRRYALANLMVSFGSAIGIFAFPPLLQLLIDSYGWKGAVILFSGINAHMLISAAIYRMPKEQHESQSKQQGRDGSAMSKLGTLKKIVRNFGFDLLRGRPVLVGFALTNVVAVGMGTIGTPPHLLARAETHNIGTSKDIAFLVSIYGIGTAAGRPLAPLLSHAVRSHMSNARLFSINLIVVGLINILSSAATAYLSYAIYAFCLGVAQGMYYTLWSQLTRDLVGPELMTAGVGLAAFCVGIGGLVGPPLAGVIYDTTGEYNNSFYFYGSVTVFGALVLLIADARYSKQQQRQTQEHEDNNNVTLVVESTVTDNRSGVLNMATQTDD